MKMWKSLRGRERLVVVFWGYYVAGGIVAIILPFILAEPLYHLGLPMWFFTLLAGLQSLYLIWAHISLWTCAFNSPRRSWGYLARSYVCLVVAVVVADTFRPFVHTGGIEVREFSSAQQAFEFARCARPTRKSEALLLAAQAERYA